MEELTNREIKQKKLDEMAKKVAQLLAESGTTFNDVDEIFRASKKYMGITFETE